MRPNEFRITSSEGLRQFGELVRYWAINPGTAPSSIEAFKKRLDDEKIPFAMHEDIVHLSVVTRSPETLTIILPLANRVDWSNGSEPHDADAYQLPAFYKDLGLVRWAGGMGEVAYVYRPDGMSKLDFDNLRLGDYITSQCM